MSNDGQFQAIRFDVEEALGGLAQSLDDATVCFQLIADIAAEDAAEDAAIIDRNRGGLAKALGAASAAAIAVDRELRRATAADAVFVLRYPDPFPPGARIVTDFQVGMLDRTRDPRGRIGGESRHLTENDERDAAQWCWALTWPWELALDGHPAISFDARDFIERIDAIADALATARRLVTNVDGVIRPKSKPPAAQKLREARRLPVEDQEEILVSFLMADAKGRLLEPGARAEWVARLRGAPYCLEISEATISRRLRDPRTRGLQALAKSLEADPSRFAREHRDPEPDY